jgi:hypothetical protein
LQMGPEASARGAALAEKRIAELIPRARAA